MFHKRKKKETRFHLNKKGFSLIEILLAVGILAIITVPLAMNMISSAQINSKSKQVASSSDLATSIVEVMQTIDLSDILTDVNGYTADEYGTPLPYTLTKTALAKYKVGKTSEMIQMDNGKKYIPVSKQEDVIQDYLVTSSINTRDTGDVVRAYFTGRDIDHDEDGIIDEYAFLLSEIETDEMLVDVLAVIEPEQSFDIVNITSMAQTEVIYLKQQQNMDQTVANEFKRANEQYIALKGSVQSIESKSADWFLNNMSRTITISIEQDAWTEATTIIMEAVYTIDTNCLREGDKTITKVLGSFSTNSTAEFARGIYLYYYPLTDVSGSVTGRDHFVINNRNELATPVYLIAMANDANTNPSTLTNYHPTLSVNEISAEIYTEVARTTICSNIDNAKWSKSLYPVGRSLNVKSIGNISEQQTMYKVTVQIYKHREGSYTGDGTFEPRSKDLLIETIGSFIDTSEKLDIDSDKTTGVTITPGVAFAGKYSLVYNEEEQVGVHGSGVEWSGTTKATNAGTYTAQATPIKNYSWPDGTNGTKTFIWTIKRSPTAVANPINAFYSGKNITGVSGAFVDWTGVTEAKDAGTYVAYATPDSNHAWSDETYQSRAIQWRISPKEVDIEWATGPDKDTWAYDGATHYGSCKITGIISGDTCTATLQNYAIKDVGTITASVVGLSNKNYALPGSGTTHRLTVYSLTSASIVTKSSDELVYNGEMQTVIESSSGVYFTGTASAKDAGTYTLIANLADGYTWPLGGTDPKVIQWSIKPLTATIAWGEREWTYDGQTHRTTCTVTNAIDGDVVTVTLSGNSIKNAGRKTVFATSISNPNYKLPSGLSTELVVNRAKLATYNTHNFDYDGYVHVGVTGQYIHKTGTTSSSEVPVSDGKQSVYTATVRPMDNYAWYDSDPNAEPNYDPITVSWTINPLCDARYEWSDMMFMGYEVQGVYGINTTHTGEIKAITVGQHTAYLTPLPNHAWKDSATKEQKTMEQRTVTWEIITTPLVKPVLDTSSFVYDGQVHSPTFISESLNSDYIVVGTTEATDYGTYTMTAKLRDPANSTWYDGTTADVVLTWYITKREVGIDWAENVWTYDRQTHYGQATPTNVVDGDTCVFYYENNSRKNQGSQTFKITGVSNPNYTVSHLSDAERSNTMTINKRVIDIVWGTKEWTYDGTEKTVLPKPGSMLVSGDTCTFTVTNNTRIDAGSQEVKITALSNDNYVLPSDVTETMTINRAKTAKIVKTNRTYNASEQNGYTEHSYVVLEGDYAKTDAGPYTFYATPDSNHEWEGGGTNKVTCEWEIYRAKEAYVYQTNTKEYHVDGDPKNGYSDYDKVDITGTASASSAGSKTFYATPKANYEWTDGGTEKRTFTWKITDHEANGTATCTTSSTCKICGITLEAAGKHNWSTYWEKDSTNHYLVCHNGCGLLGQITPHDLVYIRSEPPTCSVKGFDIYECSVCDFRKVVLTTAALGHDQVLLKEWDPQTGTYKEWIGCTRCDLKMQNKG